MSLFKALVTAQLIFCSAASTVKLDRRADNPSTFGLYAYTSMTKPPNVIGGLPIFYADGLAYIGRIAPTNATTVANVTFTKSSSDSTVWTVTSNDTSKSGDIDGKSLYINPDTGAFDQAGFVSSNSSTSSVATTGFNFYGTIAFWVSTSGNWQSFFYATPTSQTGLWQLKWNSNQTSDGVSVPVSVTREPPPPRSNPGPMSAAA